MAQHHSLARRFKFSEGVFSFVRRRRQDFDVLPALKNEKRLVVWTAKGWSFCISWVHWLYRRFLGQEKLGRSWLALKNKRVLSLKIANAMSSDTDT